MHIVGVATNVQFLRGVLRTDSFAQANLDTALIERERAVLFDREPLGLPLAAAAAVTRVLRAERSSKTAAPFTRRDGWRAWGDYQRPFDFEFRGASQPAHLTYRRDGSLWLKVGDNRRAAAHRPLRQRPAGIRIRRPAPHGRRLRSGRHRLRLAPEGATRIATIDRLAHAGETQAEGGRLTAPMPGKVVSFAVQAGDKVKPRPAAGRDGGDEDGTHDRRAGRRHGRGIALRAGRPVTEGAELLRIATAAA